MEQAAVHRIVEQHAASRGDAAAIVCGDGSISYRDLNFKANAVARHLLDAGFCRRGHAFVGTAPGIDLAAILLGVLKAGGAYTWVGNSAAPGPWHVAVSPSLDDAARTHQPVDLSDVLSQPPRPRPNLPILTRGSDIACVLREDEGEPLLIPHSTIAALRPSTLLDPQLWEGDRTTFDLWTVLMAGGTLAVEGAPALLKAA